MSIQTHKQTPSPQPPLELIQTTATKPSKIHLTALSSLIHPSPSISELQLFMNQSTPKKTSPANPLKPFLTTKTYTFQFSLLTMLLAGILILTLLVVCWDFQTKKRKLLSDITSEIKSCSLSFLRNKCHLEGSHLKFQTVQQRCFQLKECMESDPEHQLSIRLSVANLVGQIIGEFLNGLGVVYLLLLSLLVFCVSCHKGKERLTCELKN